MRRDLTFTIQSSNFWEQSTIWKYRIHILAESAGTPMESLRQTRLTPKKLNQLDHKDAALRTAIEG